MSWGDGGREIVICNGFGKLLHQDSDDNEDNGQEYHPPANDHAVATHTEEFKGTGFANRTKTSPESIDSQQGHHDNKSNHSSMNINIHKSNNY